MVLFEITLKINAKIGCVKWADVYSFLTRFGMINLRSDGTRMIIAQKYERDAPSGKWDIQEMIFNDNSGRFERIA